MIGTQATFESPARTIRVKEQELGKSTVLLEIIDSLQRYIELILESEMIIISINFIVSATIVLSFNIYADIDTEQ